MFGQEQRHENTTQRNWSEKPCSRYADRGGFLTPPHTSQNRAIADQYKHNDHRGCERYQSDRFAHQDLIRRNQVQRVMAASAERYCRADEDTPGKQKLRHIESPDQRNFEHVAGNNLGADSRNETGKTER